MSKVTHAGSEMHPHLETPQRPESSSYLGFGKERCTSEMSVCCAKRKKYMFCVPARFIYRSATIFSVATERRIKKKTSFCVGRNNHRRKSNFVAFDKRNATGYEQNV